MLFHEDFESAWGRWDRLSSDALYIGIETFSALKPLQDKPISKKRG